MIRRLGVPGLVLGVLAALLLPSSVAQAAGPPDGGRLIALTDQDYDNRPAARIRVMDPAVADWNTPPAQKWVWSPTSSNGFSDLTGAWGLPTDAKLRRVNGKYVVLVTDSRGLAAVVSYPSGRRVWGADVGAPNNPHSIELLPNGNVAVAASTGGFIRIYTASQGTASYVTYPLHDAHGVQWDPTRQLLWVLGGDTLAGLKIGGTPAEPVITEGPVITLPTGGGHDLSPALDNPDRLWVSTGSKVYQVSKSTHEIVTTLDRAGIKAIGTTPTGRQVWTTPKAGCRTTWCTDTVNFAVPEGMRALTGAEIYKARIWSSRYE
jgi:hypothetical protein